MTEIDEKLESEMFICLESKIKESPISIVEFPIKSVFVTVKFDVLVCVEVCSDMVDPEKNVHLSISKSKSFVVV